ncbi:hypothetical protein SprV_0602069300 [Sparganum proliferum]
MKLQLYLLLLTAIVLGTSMDDAGCTEQKSNASSQISGHCRNFSPHREEYSGYDAEDDNAGAWGSGGGDRCGGGDGGDRWHDGGGGDGRKW